jgi:hypothetical protein
MEQLIRAFVILQRMNAKPVPPASEEHHFMEGVDVVPRADGHAFFLGKTDVVAGLLFHSSEDFLLIAREYPR